jgi:hypothetical protein
MWDHRSLWLDLKILAMTFLAVLGGEGVSAPGLSVPRNSWVTQPTIATVRRQDRASKPKAGYQELTFHTNMLTTSTKASPNTGSYSKDGNRICNGRSPKPAMGFLRDWRP